MIFQPDLLKGQVAFITGGGTGLGFAMATAMARCGADIAIASRKPKHLDAAAEKLATHGTRVVAIPANVREPDSVRVAVERVVADLGRIDILVNNAGFSHRKKSISEVTEDEFDRIFAVNVKAIYLAVQEVLPVFRRQGGGCIVNTSSTAAMRPRPDLSIYNSSKGAVNTLTKSLAVELAPERIRVNAVCPVIGETALLETFMGVADTPENRRAFEATIPLGRFSRPEDIARAALFLACDDAEFITGVTLEVDGGRCV